MDEEKIDFLGPAFIMAVIAALMSDFAFIFLLALPIPIIGFAIALIVIMFHYFAGLIVLFFVFLKLKHLMPKLVLLLSIILPLPFLSIGMVLAIILQNRIIEFVVTQVAIQAIAVATAGAGEILEAGAVAEAGAAAAEAGVTAARAGVETSEAGAEVAAETVGEIGPRLQQPIKKGVRSTQKPTAPEETPVEPLSDNAGLESDEDIKLSERKKAIGDKLDKIKEGFDDGEEKNEEERVEKPENEEESNES